MHITILRLTCCPPRPHAPLLSLRPVTLYLILANGLLRNVEVYWMLHIVVYQIQKGIPKESWSSDFNYLWT